MVQLKQRLEETESQMSRILKAMEHVQARVEDGLEAHLSTDRERANEMETVTPEVSFVRPLRALWCRKDLSSSHKVCFCSPFFEF